MKQRRGSLYLLTGVLLGVGLGLLYAWVVAAPPKVEAEPASLRQDLKDEYRILIASAFVSNGDLVRARARLEKLGDNDPYRGVIELVRRIEASGGSQSDLLALQLLAAALSADSSALPLSTPSLSP